MKKILSKISLINLIIFANLFLIIYIIYRDYFFHKNSTAYNGYYDIYYLILFTTLFIWIFIKYFATPKTKQIVYIVFFSIVFSLYLFELLLFSNFLFKFKVDKVNEKIDPRTKYEVLVELSDSRVVPSMSPKYFLRSANNIKNFAPMAGISHKKTVMCKENGPWIIYDSDRYGFNNYDKIWNNDNLFSYVIGDSFAYGACVNQNETISAKLGKYGYNSINLAYSGNGPLYMLGSLKEYYKLKKVNYVLWFYYEGNDLIDLQAELGYENFNLQKYLDDEFSQNLIKKQNFINEQLTKFYLNEQKKRLEINSKIKKERIKKYGYSGRASNFDFKRFLKLYEIRVILGIAEYRVSDKTKETFFEIVSNAKNFAEKNNSKFIFIYLPRYAKNMKYSNNYQKNEIINGLKMLDIPVLDIHEKIFKKHSDPLSLFPFRKKGHYNKEGYDLVSREVLKFLNLSIK